MDTRNLFQKISQKMLAEFNASAEVKHRGLRGSLREANLRRFLAEKLPMRYGLGAGEVIGHVRDTSRQCDIIVYDKLNIVPLIYDENASVFPIEGVYGIVEVKSALTKPELIDALEKIKAFKELAPGGKVSQQIAGGWTMVHDRPKPFGMIFAYSLAKNSMQSLLKNLQEWENSQRPEAWPNYICILNQGVLFHHGKTFDPCIDSNKIDAQSWPMCLEHKEDSLFKFFSSIHDLCTQMQLGPIQLASYYDPPIRIGKYVVDGRAADYIRVQDGAKIRPSEKLIDKVVSWCATNGSMSYGDFLKKRLGSLPLGMEGSPRLRNQVFLYNPDNLPGLHEATNPFSKTAEGTLVAGANLLNLIELSIDGRHYAIAATSLEENDFEEVGFPH